METVLDSKSNPQPSVSSQTSHGRTRNEIINNTTDYYINDLKANPRNITPEQIEVELMGMLEEQFDLENATRPRGMQKYTPPAVLPPDVIAELMNKCYHIKRIALAGLGADAEYDLIGMYVEDGPDMGIYTTSEVELTKAARRFNRRLDKRGFDAVVFALGTLVDRVERYTDRDLIVVNNGIYNYATKELLPFTPDRVFVSKCRVNYNPMAKNIVIHNPDDGSDWDVESWMRELSDDPDVVELFWKILGAVIRPNVKWNISAWFYGTTGNNGKGTLCALMSNLCGVGTHASIPFSDFGKDFLLEPLIHASAIVVDENDVGQFIDKAANLKAIITNDTILMNRKHKAPIDFQFIGFMVQCINEMPRFKDKTESFYRRQLFVSFNKCFTGRERRYIKDDYLQRPEVLQYVLKRVVTMPNYYKLDVPESCRAALDEFKEYNDPVRQFLDEMLPLFQWDLLPNDFLYDLYKAWFKRNNPSGTIQGKNSFLSDVRQYITTSTQWTDNTKKLTRSDKRIVGPEPLIFEYELNNWYNPTYTGHDPARVCTLTPKSHYYGLLRASKGPSGDGVDNTEDE